MCRHHCVGPRWAFALATLVPWARGQDALGQQPAAVRQFVTRSWTSDDALPQNTVTALLQVRDGALWIGTLGGLCRFDGARFRTYMTDRTPGLTSNRIRALCETRDGVLWIGTDNGGVVRCHAGEFTPFELPDHATVHCLAENRAGRLFVGSAAGLSWFDGARLWPVPQPAMGSIQTLLACADGELLAAGTAGLWRVEDLGATALLPGPVTQMAEAPDRTVWLVTDQGVGRWRAAGWELLATQPTLRGPISVMRFAADGALWLGAGPGLLRLPPGGLAQPDAASPGDAVLPALHVQAILPDRSGNLWVGTRTRGLIQLRASTMAAYGPAAGLPNAGLLALVAEPDGALLVATHVGLFRGRDGRFAPLPETAGLRGVTSLLRDPDGTLWCGVADGLACVRSGAARVWRPADRVPAGSIRALIRDGHDALWLGTEDGVRALRGDRIEDPPELAPLHGLRVHSLAVAADGALWIGAVDHLFRFDLGGKQLRGWHAGQHLPYGAVRAVLPEAGVHAWIASYGGGLCRIAPDRVVQVDERHGLPDHALCSVLVWQDQLVVGCNRGVFRVARRELDAVAEGRADMAGCDLFDGVPGVSVECTGGSQPSACLAGDTAWLCGVEALLAVRPGDLPAHATAVTCSIDEVLAGPRRWGAPASLVAPPGLRDVTVRLSGYDLAHPQLTRFRWRLGSEQSWSPPQFESEVRLAALAAGDYQFEAQALDPHGHASAALARLHLSIPPLLWETTWFRALLPLVMVAGAVLLLRVGAAFSAARARHLQQLVAERTAELRAAQERLEERVAERTRELSTALTQLRDDLAERQRLERQVVQLQRMETVGQMAGGIAHDFNNLLTVVLSGSTLLAEATAGTPAGELADSIRAAGERGRRLTQRLLALASRQVVAVELIDLNRVVGDLLAVLRPLVGPTVELRLRPAAAPVLVRAAVSQIEQVLINLGVNAREAMPRGGHLTITLAAGAAWHRLLVQDDGIGMSESVRERAFEPFFTTKPAGSGANSGLGLSTVYGIVKQLAGTVRIDSTPGQGTTFVVELPAASGVAPTAASAPTPMPPPPPPRPRHGRVLLVDDEPAVRQVLRRMLEGAGFAVTEAPDGAAAVTCLQRNAEVVDVVLSDVLMPGLRGAELASALRAERPNLPIVFLTGYTEGAGTAAELVAAGFPMLQKPPSLAELVAMLEHARATVPPAVAAP